jgi:hypothetical protein
MAYRLTPWRVLMECAAPAPVTVLDGEPEAEAPEAAVREAGDDTEALIHRLEGGAAGELQAR